MTYFLEYLKLNNSTQLLTFLVTTEGQVKNFCPFSGHVKALNLNPDFVKETLPLIKQMPGITHKISVLTLELDKEGNHHKHGTAYSKIEK